MQKVVLALCLASSAAFNSPAGSVRSSSVAVSAKSASIPFLEAPEALDGSYAGDKGFDPVGFTKLDWDMSEAIVPKKAGGRPEGGISMLYWMREAELKHGRICMLAIVGWISVDLGFHFPAAKYEGLSSLAAHDVMVANGNMGFMLVVVGFLELIGAIAIIQAANGSGREPGYFALDPYGWNKGEKKAFQQEAEITHCRLAMLAFSGLCTQAALTGKAFPYF